MRQERVQVEAAERRESAPGALPAGTPAWITPELIEATQKVWEPRYGRPLSPAEAITIVQNAGRLFELLSRE
ncbi:hypothetical protein RAS2_19790 [Phycisphaerae bacterium RAS2]|nr:hypothetical protein RAS2_19790 [Phycisphaerae bacterium RAS2]